MQIMSTNWRVTDWKLGRIRVASVRLLPFCHLCGAIHPYHPALVQKEGLSLARTGKGYDIDCYACGNPSWCMHALDTEQPVTCRRTQRARACMQPVRMNCHRSTRIQHCTNYSFIREGRKCAIDSQTYINTEDTALVVY